VPVLRAALSPLVERDFRLLFVGRTVSLFGTAFAPIALAFAVLDIGGSATDLGLVVAASALPQVIFILVGGIWADRLLRHHVMVVSDSVAGAVQAAIAALVLTGAAEIWHLVALQLVRGTATAFFFPAAQGIVPQTVSARLLQEANALFAFHATVRRYSARPPEAYSSPRSDRVGRSHLTRRPTSPARRSSSRSASHAI
jgi:MFS family permease